MLKDNTEDPYAIWINRITNKQNNRRLLVKIKLRRYHGWIYSQVPRYTPTGCMLSHSPVQRQDIGREALHRVVPVTLGLGHTVQCGEQQGQQRGGMRPSQQPAGAC